MRSHQYGNVHFGPHSIIMPCIWFPAVSADFVKNGPMVGLSVTDRDVKECGDFGMVFYKGQYEGDTVM